MKKRCKHCGWWKNKQRELDYQPEIGFCNFDFTEDYSESRVSAYIYDAWTKVEHDVLDSRGTVKPWRWNLVTHQNFGCRFFEKPEKN